MHLFLYSSKLYKYPPIFIVCCILKLAFFTQHTSELHFAKFRNKSGTFGCSAASGMRMKMRHFCFGIFSYSQPCHHSVRFRKYIAVGLHDVRARPAATILRRESEWVRERAEDYSSRCFIHHSGKWCMVLTAIKVYICERANESRATNNARPAVGNMHVVPVAYISWRAAHHSSRGLAWLCALQSSPRLIWRDSWTTPNTTHGIWRRWKKWRAHPALANTGKSCVLLPFTCNCFDFYWAHFYSMFECCSTHTAIKTDYVFYCKFIQNAGFSAPWIFLNWFFSRHFYFWSEYNIWNMKLEKQI